MNDSSQPKPLRLYRLVRRIEAVILAPEGSLTEADELAALQAAARNTPWLCHGITRAAHVQGLSTEVLDTIPHRTQGNKPGTATVRQWAMLLGLTGFSPTPLAEAHGEIVQGGGGLEITNPGPQECDGTAPLGRSVPASRGGYMHLLGDDWGTQP